jgi:hypothetical protein
MEACKTPSPMVHLFRKSARSLGTSPNFSLFHWPKWVILASLTAAM